MILLEYRFFYIIIKILIKMPKLKTNSGAAKRFILTGSGKIK